MKKIDNKLLSKLLIVFLIIQPIFELSFFYGSISTLIRVVIILILFILTFKMDDNKKLKKLLIGYLSLVVVYFIFHELNARNFNSLIPGNFDYNILNEMLYFLKMSMSVFLIYSIFKSNITIEELNKPINITVLLISGSIVLLNLLSLSYSAYSFEIISGNIFTWFTNHEFLFDDLASKGYFELANQITAILILYLPLIIYFFFKEFKLLNIATLFIMILSLLMLGTRIAIYGGLLVLLFTVVLYLLFIFIKKEKTTIFKIITIIIFGILFIFMINYSPVKLKQNFYENIYQKNNEIVENEDVINTEKESNKNNDSEEFDKLAYILNNYQEKLIFEEFILYSYPYQFDPDFWIKIIAEDVTKRVDTRYLEIEMVKRVKEINNNKLDDWLGLTYTRVMNIFNIERDYVMQYYSLGIIGTIIMLGPYFLVIIISVIKILKDFKNKFNFKNITLLSSVSIILFSAYFSGNILNGLGCIIPISFICGVLLKEVSYDKINKD